MHIWHRGQRTKRGSAHKKGHGQRPHQQDPDCSCHCGHARHAGVHPLCMLRIPGATWGTQHALQVGSVRALPLSLHTGATHYLHRSDARVGYLEVHRHQVRLLNDEVSTAKAV